jgi:hypothetical protein
MKKFKDKDDYFGDCCVRESASIKIAAQRGRQAHEYTSAAS